MSILVIIENQNGSIHRISREAIVGAQSLGTELGLPVKALVFGNNIQPLVDEVSAYDLSEVLKVENELLSDYTAEGWTSTLQQIIVQESPSYVIVGHSYQVRDYCPKLSVRLKKPMLSDVAGFTIDGGKPVFTRTTFNGKLNSGIVITGDAPALICFQSAAFQADSIKAGSAPIREVTISLSSEDILSKPEAPFQEETGGVDLSSARLIVSVGRGIGKMENIPMAEALAKKLGAELGSSRPVVDAGWLPQSRQVGSSGQTVSPKLYFALGISGAIQHIVGMKGSKNIIAINKDGDAPIFEIADYGVVGDILEIVPKLTEALP
ncbi:MAG: electron transfer flavoprotein subunit alpha/FixB family protein [Candidatus Marinimicrobia bacterium]|nr:electron transfer flavoprotein subunit alpha/FixB family protein [Candidatus Neomarinimicrobiota bacterium]